jgi:hypothetical protein
MERYGGSYNAIIILLYGGLWLAIIMDLYGG